MLIDCICGESKFAINAEQIGFDGRLVKCGKCGKEWFQESKPEIIVKKLNHRLFSSIKNIHHVEIMSINLLNVVFHKIIDKYNFL